MYLTPFSKSYADGLRPWPLFCVTQHQVCTRASHLEKHHCGSQTACSQHSLGGVSTTDWLLSCASTLFVVGRPSPTRWSLNCSAFCHQPPAALAPAHGNSPHSFWNSRFLILILDKSEMTHRDKQKKKKNLKGDASATTRLNSQAAEI